MKKIFIFIIGLLTSIQWVEAITVSMGTTTTTGWYPLNVFYEYSGSQCLFLTSEIEIGSKITSLQGYRNEVEENPHALELIKIWFSEKPVSVSSGKTWKEPGILLASMSSIEIQVKNDMSVQDIGFVKAKTVRDENVIRGESSNSSKRLILDQVLVDYHVLNGDNPFQSAMNLSISKSEINQVDASNLCKISPYPLSNLSRTGNEQDKNEEIKGDPLLVTNKSLDFGDAPSPYPTLSASDGARHSSSSTTCFIGGPDIDFEGNGQPNTTATGDDITQIDDEDGVTFNTPLYIGQTASMTVKYTGVSNNYLQVWIDFNADGDWADAGEKIFNNRVLFNGNNTLNFPIPSNATIGNTYMRFRISTTQNLNFTGLASNGEVEDHMVTIQNPVEYDWGDAPDSNYQTLAASNGARHGNNPSGYYLGSLIDYESNGQPNATATGDDNNNLDDEDGIIFNTDWVKGKMAQISVIASATGKLNAWCDWNCDGDWNDTNEQFLTNAVMSPGTNTINLNIPSNAVVAATFCRFRFNSSGGLSFYGQASDGEVEDYQVIIKDYTKNAYWDFNENQGNIANDISGNNNHGTITNPSWTSGYYGSALQFNGYNVYVTVPHSTSLNIICPFSIQAWIKASGSEAYYAIVDKYTYDPAGNKGFCFYLTDGKLRLSIYSGAAGTGDIFGTTDLRDNIFHHVFASWDGTTMKLYVDGNLQASVPWSNAPASTTANIGIGRRLSGWGGYMNFQGIIDEVIISNDPILQFDFGDAPYNPPSLNYPTYMAQNGARHIVVPGIQLGNLIDSETDGQLDDNDPITGNLADEDGVLYNWPNNMVVGFPMNIKVYASTSGKLDAWMDFNDNGNWNDPGEQIFNSASLSQGNNFLSFVIPRNASTAFSQPQYYARYRFSTAGGLTYYGSAANGEVEDYPVSYSINNLYQWSQPYQQNFTNLPGLHCHDGMVSGQYQIIVGADDFICHEGNVSGIVWYGSYEQIGSGIKEFHLGIFNTSANCIPLDPGIWNDTVPFASVNQKATGVFNSMGNMIYQYTYILPTPLQLTPGGTYWLRINSISNNINNPAQWKWQEASRSRVPALCSAVTRSITGGAPGPWSPIWWSNQNTYTEFAFNILSEMDFGDAPSPYPTTLANNGACHSKWWGPLMLGTFVDYESDGQPNALANGDDLNAQPDEDGVVFLTPLIVGQNATIQITVTGTDTGLLQGWIDFNIDGDWADPGEQIIYNLPVSPGSMNYNILVPPSAVAGQSYARFRISRWQTPPNFYDGYLPDGEVEDYAVTLYSNNFDWGDAPDPTYPTLSLSNGARHKIVPNIYLGTLIDSEIDAWSSPDAKGDNKHGLNDEDGVKFMNLLIPGQICNIQITASIANGYLQAWMDFNQDGDWNDAGEQIITNQVLASGINLLAIPIPPTAKLGKTFARFRFSTSPNLTPFGLANDGEVEDYQIFITKPDGTGMHWPQYPKPGGWDVEFAGSWLADDFLCTSSSPISYIRFWISWKLNYVNPVGTFTVSICKDIPAEANSQGFSIPGPEVWTQTFSPGQYNEMFMDPDPQGWFNMPPGTGYNLNDHIFWKQITLNNIVNPFIPQQDSIYWLKIRFHDYDWVFKGWKESNGPQFNDVAIFYEKSVPQLIPLFDPMDGHKIDLSFIVSSQPFLDVTVTATPSIICAGETVQLLATATGGSGNYTYLWTSDPPGFTSTLPDPTVNPIVTTIYTVKVSDGFDNVRRSVMVTVNQIPTVTCPQNLSLCLNDPPYTLTGGTPSGGVYSGPGVSGGKFYPSVAGIGTFTITYTYTDPQTGCSNSCTFQITVKPLPTVTCPQNLSLCLNDPPYTLTGGTPSGGVYSGPGVSGGKFYPSVAGVGTFTITYTYTDPQTGCSNSCTFQITVKPLPTVTCPQNLSLCLNDPPYTLTGGTPSGGVYSGPGVSGGKFYPSVAGVGTFTITYTYTNPQTGCSNSCTFLITVKPLPTVSCPPNFSVCLVEPPVVLSGGLPAGGVYAGPGVNGGLFYPSVAGVGNHTITYTYTDPQTNCTNMCAFIATVTAAQSITLPAGWSGISSHIVPTNPNMVYMFAPVYNNLVIVYNWSNMYYPGGNILPTLPWDTYSGYNIKMTQNDILTICGNDVLNRTLNLQQGWNLTPVLSNSDVDVTTVYGSVNQVLIVLEVAGPRMYWKQYGINTIGNLLPGKAYLVNCSAACSVVFPAGGNAKSSNPVEPFLNLTGWNDVNYTPITHLFAFEPEACKILEPGDYIGLFTSNGICAGMMNFTENDQALGVIAFGDDIYSEKLNGFVENEKITFKVWKKASQRQFVLDVEFSNEYSGKDRFVPNGISVIKSMKILVPEANTTVAVNFTIYPNPAHGIFNIEGRSNKVKATIANASGNELFTIDLSLPGVIDLTRYPGGIYFVKLESGEEVFVKKLIVE